MLTAEGGSLEDVSSVMKEVVLQGDIHPRYAMAIMAAQLSHRFEGPGATAARIGVAAALFFDRGAVLLTDIRPPIGVAFSMTISVPEMTI